MIVDRSTLIMRQRERAVILIQVTERVVMGEMLEQVDGEPLGGDNSRNFGRCFSNWLYCRSVGHRRRHMEDWWVGRLRVCVSFAQMMMMDSVVTESG